MSFKVVSLMLGELLVRDQPSAAAYAFGRGGF